MSRSFTYDGATELAGATRLGSFSFTGAAHKGEVGDGGFDFDDPAAAANLVGLKPFTAEEDDSTPALFFSGFIADRGIGRGPFRVDSDRQWQTAVVDLNSYLDDVLLRDTGANRPAETDIARITWLLSSGALAVDDTYFITDDPVDMDAADYRGRHARDVLDECGEASGKNYFLRDGGDGPFLSYYDSTGDTDPAAGSISSVLSEVDNTTTFAPAWGDVPALQRDPSRVYSGVEVQYGDAQSVFVENGTTLSTFRQRETSVFDSAATTVDGATTIANQFLEAASTEEDTIECPLILPADKLGLYLPGQKVDTNFPHLGGAFSYRISRRTVAPAGEDAPSHDHYLVTLILTVPVKITRFSGRGTAGAGGVPSGVGDVTAQGNSAWQELLRNFDTTQYHVPPPGILSFSWPDVGDTHDAFPSPITPVFPFVSGPAIFPTVSRLWLQLSALPPSPFRMTGFKDTADLTPPTAPTVRIRGAVWDQLVDGTYSDTAFPIEADNFLLAKGDDLYHVTFLGGEQATGTFTVADEPLNPVSGDFGSGMHYRWQIECSLSGTISSRQILIDTEDDELWWGYVNFAATNAGFNAIAGRPVYQTYLDTSDGTTADYTLPLALKPNTLVVWVGGLPWWDGFVETSPTTFTFTEIPQASNVIRFSGVAA